jgi:2,3,4,5-tetrahydropyridine-2-carboxylate N-succinyltransferase
MIDKGIFAFGLGLDTRNSQDEVIEIMYTVFQVNPTDQVSEILTSITPPTSDHSIFFNLSEEKQKTFIAMLGEQNESELQSTIIHLINTDRPITVCVIKEDSPPLSIPEAFLKLHLLSSRLIRPHKINIERIFGLLRNIAWTNQGPIDLEDLAKRRLVARASGKHLSVDSVDKFPKMTDYIVPSGIRIANSARVRLGAFLGEGTTIMHEGFVNFNAGTDGPAMIEGRVSAGVMIGADSDLGGGCSTMGTLSGGGKEIISVGKNCLIGANAGIGIPLGDRCIVEAGLYVTAGTKLTTIDVSTDVKAQVKARELAGKDDLLFRRNSYSGAVECLINSQLGEIQLNAELHSND